MRWGFEGPQVTISPSHTLPGSQQVAKGDNGETFSGVTHRDQDYEIVPAKDLKTVFLSTLLVDDWLFVIGNWPIQDVVITIHAWRTLQANMTDELAIARGTYCVIEVITRTCVPGLSRSCHTMSHHRPGFVTAEPLSVQPKLQLQIDFATSIVTCHSDPKP